MLRPKILPVRLVKVDTDKVGRAYVQQAKFEAGRVLFRRGAPYLPELETELLRFPQGKNYDIVDSITHRPGATARQTGAGNELLLQQPDRGTQRAVGGHRSCLKWRLRKGSEKALSAS